MNPRKKKIVHWSRLVWQTWLVLDGRKREGCGGAGNVTGKPSAPELERLRIWIPSTLRQIGLGRPQGARAFILLSFILWLFSEAMSSSRFCYSDCSFSATAATLLPNLPPLTVLHGFVLIPLSSLKSLETRFPAPWLKMPSKRCWQRVL